MPAILLLDDLKKEREDVKQSLEMLINQDKLPESEILETSTGEEALELLKSRDDIYLACIDIIQEEATDGLEVAKAIHEKREIPVVLITGSYSITDYETLKHWFMEGNGNNTPVSICAKLGFTAETYNEYAQALLKSINEANSKIGKGNDTNFYDRVIKKTKDSCPPDLYHSLKVFFKQIRARINKELHDVLPSDFKKRASDIEWLLNESKDTRALLHNMRKPSGAYQMLGKIHKGAAEKYPAIFKQAKLINEVINYVNNSVYRYCPLIPELKEHKRELENNRKSFPNIGSAKLNNRLKVLLLEYAQFFIVSYDEDLRKYETMLGAMLQKTGRVIARSMGSEDSLGFPMAGMYDSKIVSSLDELCSATEEIRAMESQKLSDFLLGKGLAKPHKDTMHVLVEVYYPTKYKGSVLQHHNFPHLFLIEYSERETVIENKANIAFLYDSKLGKVYGENANLGIDHRLLAENLHKLLLERRDVCNTSSDMAVQMEYGFDDTLSLFDFQLRGSKRIIPKGNYAKPDNLVFGSTHAEGTEMIVIYPDSPEQVSLVSQRAAEDGYMVCMVIPSELEEKAHLAAIPENLGLVITGKGLTIQSHGYFNALVNAENFVALQSDKAITRLNLQSGQKLLYKSDGLSYSIELYDTTKKIIQGVRELINNS